MADTPPSIAARDLVISRGSRVLVTGGCGFIGAALVRRLVKLGAEVSVIDDLSTGHFTEVGDLPGVRLVRGSVLDRGCLEQASEGAQFVFHLAGLVGMRMAMAQAKRAYDVALEGTRNVLAVTNNVPTVLFSSSAVYGQGRTGEAANENWVVQQDDLIAYDGGNRGYAAGKWEVEKLSQEASANGRPCIAVRPFNVVGTGQTGAYGMVLPNFIESAVNGRPLRVYDDGLQSRCFCDVESFITHLLRLASEPKAYARGGRAINLGNPLDISILELAELVVGVTGNQSEIEFIPYETDFPNRKDVRHRWPSVEIFESLIGKATWVPIDAVVKELAEAAYRKSGGPTKMRSASALADGKDSDTDTGLAGNG